jgi:NAD(P)-dependent dehydrogenase (short-subunit alcohol dehydrogenase family)
MAKENRIAFITGANRGIGLETARGLGKLGITVLVGARSASQGQAAVSALSDDGITTAEAVEFDVAKSEHHKRIADLIAKRFGHLDILVNNAGVMLDPAEMGNPAGFNTASTVPEKALRDTFEVNFFGPALLTRSLLPLIVNLSSILGSLTLHADPASQIYGVKAFAYDASKTALNAFTVHLAAELKDTRIKVNSAHPGWVKTEMGGDGAPMELKDGGKTSIQLATLPDNGPTGGFFHLGEKLPW